MNDLRTIRIFLSVIFLAASISYLFIGVDVNPMAQISLKMQIIPSALSMTIGATSLWLVATFLLGRIYCSSVCPVGALQDSATWLRRKLTGLKFVKRVRIGVNHRLLFPPFRYKRPRSLRKYILVIYAGFLLLGLITFAALLEPWNMMRAAARLTNHQGAEEWKWLFFAGNVVIGGIIGMLILFAIWLWALFAGRRFCVEVCPIGTILGYISYRAIYQIEIDPDRCTNCLRCEEVCKSGSIKIVSRYVDNGNCVRCFDCLKVCGDNAIRYQRNRNRRSNPLLQRRART